jgi:hypothetical protein
MKLCESITQAEHFLNALSREMLCQTVLSDPKKTVWEAYFLASVFHAVEAEFFSQLQFGQSQYRLSACARIRSD